MSNNTPEPPSPNLFFQTVNAYERTAAIKGAIELDIFTAMADGPATAAELARHCAAAERGVRIVADYLTILGFLTQDGARYALTPDSAMFLNRKSPAYAGGMMQFLLAPELRRGYDNIAARIRREGTGESGLGTLAPEHPVWLEFARAMEPLMRMSAQMLAELSRWRVRRRCWISRPATGRGEWRSRGNIRAPNWWRWIGRRCWS